jgi:hypothetical protein
MENYDISHLPPAVHDALLHLLETIVQAFPVAAVEVDRIASPAADSQTRFPRGATELLLLEALEALAPMPASPAQVAALAQKPREEVRTLLQALATLGTIHHPGSGLYRHRLPGEDVQRRVPRGARQERLARQGLPVDTDRPSRHYAARIAAAVQASHTKD